MTRRKCRTIRVGAVAIGGEAPVSVQSMTNTDTRDAMATLAQIEKLHKAGADIVRVSVYDEKCVQSVRKLVDYSPVPLVADIHFDHRLALGAMENGIHKLRINPGNIERKEDVRRMVDCAKAHGVPIRIGVNTGSLPKDLVETRGVTPESMVEAALRHVRILEEYGFYDIALSLKASDVRANVQAYRRMAEICDYPLHLGVTEAGRKGMGTVKSDIGIGALLLDGIGDTIRVSLSGDPVPEVAAGINILRAIGLRRDAVNIVSCPTCGRKALDVDGLAKEVESRLAGVELPITVAIMGCVVNGPGEAKQADVGIAGGGTAGALFRHGVLLRRVPKDQLLGALMEEIGLIAKELGKSLPPSVLRG